MSGFRVLVVGGYGFFGRRLVERLARWPELELVIAGRSAAGGRALVDALRGTARATLSSTVL
ncbi:MAG TPA: saccharopine dehydrogenase, partial [Burkholderiaceae bacterium]